MYIYIYICIYIYIYIYTHQAVKTFKPDSYYVICKSAINKTINKIYFYFLRDLNKKNENKKKIIRIFTTPITNYIKHMSSVLLNAVNHFVSIKIYLTDSIYLN